MRSLKILAFLAVLSLGETLCAADKLPDGIYAEFTTPRGVMIAELFASKVPLTVASFVGLTEGTLAPKDGKPFYTGLTWYRVVPGFVIQSGNPGLKDTGDESIPHKFPDEFVPGLRHGETGILSMANAGPDTNGCEFFITLGDDTRLNYLHSVFGRVVRGVELLPQIKPDEAFSIKILRVGPAAQAFKADEATFKARVAQARPYSGEREPGTTAHFADPDSLLPAEPPRSQYFNYKLNNFQRATGVKIVARLFAKSPPAAEDKVPGAYMRALAEKLGVARRGALAAYFAADDDWRVWIGDESTSAFLGRPATAEDLVVDGAFHKVKETFLDATHAAGDAAFLAQQKAAAPDRQPTSAQHLKLQTDAVLDGLILKLEPK
jgi:cyclophilin family peptidyl-prolyl cis-trans isomerase